MGPHYSIQITKKDPLFKMRHHQFRSVDVVWVRVNYFWGKHCNLRFMRKLSCTPLGNGPVPGRVNCEAAEGGVGIPFDTDLGMSSLPGIDNCGCPAWSAWACWTSFHNACISTGVIPSNRSITVSREMTDFELLLQWLTIKIDW